MQATHSELHAAREWPWPLFRAGFRRVGNFNRRRDFPVERPRGLAGLAPIHACQGCASYACSYLCRLLLLLLLLPRLLYKTSTFFLSQPHLLILSVFLAQSPIYFPRSTPSPHSFSIIFRSIQHLSSSEVVRSLNIPGPLLKHGCQLFPAIRY